ncbi:MAG: ORF6N domain-containing protein [Spirochaetia bacterium]|nr:ORF6N domain-containing protein [Spirochaetia bacterium]
MNDLINIENKILVIRGQQVMLDRDLAELYGVETGRLNEAVKRNIERFPDYFCFQLNQTEFGNWKSQFAISNSVKMGLRKKPYAFTEQGVAMLSAVLRSETAVKVSIDIMNAFVAMRHYLHRNADLINRVNSIENKIDMKIIEYDENFSKIFKVIDFGPVPIKQGVFVQGQIFDAYTKFQELIQKAQKEIILIDNYIDLTVLDRLTAKSPGVDVIIYTQPQTPIKKLDIAQFNAQYPTLTIKNTTSMHDRFLIIDRTEIYHIGASLKDLGKKCFGFTRLEEAHLMIKTVMEAI